MCDTGMVEEALKELDQLEVSDNHPFAAFIYYLKGKCYLRKEQWRRAERSLYNGIRLAEQSSEGKTANIEAASYYYLTLSSIAKNRSGSSNGGERFTSIPARGTAPTSLL